MTQIGVDIGGTFTDGAFVTADGHLRVVKVPSTPMAPEAGVNDACRLAAVDPQSVERFVHGTTLITNLLIERRGERIALLTTAGFEDVLELQFGDKPNTYDMAWIKPLPFVPRSLRAGVAERVDGKGRVVVALSEEQTAAVVDWLRAEQPKAVAICFLNAHVNAEHERAMAAAIRRDIPELDCCISSDVDPNIREYERTSTTVLNAYAMPKVTKYIGERMSEWGDVRYMSSAGGLVDARTATTLPITLAFSGPAGGVVGAVALGAAAGYGDLITFDMGGTSTDVAIVQNGRPDVRRTTDVDWGIPCRFASFDIKSVGAGGGSIVAADHGGALKVGPRSAGVQPGPACYGRGGEEPTVTDANLLLGLLPLSAFGGGSIAVDAEAAERAFERLSQGFRHTAAELALGAFRLVNANMAQAIREITVYRGIDPRTFSLCCFGSAGGQHAVAVARELRIPRVIVPAAASVFSAVGMLSARLEAYGSCPVNDDLGAVFTEDLQQRFRQLEDRLRANYDEDAFSSAWWVLEARHVGQNHSLDVPYYPGGDTQESVRRRFLDEHVRLFGMTGRSGIEVVAARLTLASVDSNYTAWRPVQRTGSDGDAALTGNPVMGEEAARFVARAELSDGDTARQPVVIVDELSTTYVPTGCRWHTDSFGSLVIDVGQA